MPPRRRRLRNELLNGPSTRIGPASEDCDNVGNLLVRRNQLRWAFPPPAQQYQREPKRLLRRDFVSSWNVAPILHQTGSGFGLDEVDDELLGYAAVVIGIRFV